MSALPNADQRFGPVECEFGSAAAALYDSIGAASEPAQLDEIARLMWRAYSHGDVSDDEATFLGSSIERRRSRLRGPGRRPVASLSGRCVILRFPKRKPQRCPDRQKSYERRHRLAYSGVMPHHLAAKFTVGEMACLRVVADEHKANGWCDLSLAEIAARAGVCRKTAKRAVLAAGRWGERLIESKERPRPGRKHRTNLVRIVSQEWLTWLARKPAAAATTGGHFVAPTDTNLNDDTTTRVAREGSRGFASPSGNTRSAEAEESGLPFLEGEAKPCLQPKPSADAVRLANQVAVIAGYRLRDLPRSWTDANPEVVVQTWLNTGWAPSMILNVCRWVMSRKKHGPPFSPRYFSCEIIKLGPAPIGETRR